MKKGLYNLLCILFFGTSYSQFYTDPLKVKLDSVFSSINQNDPGGYIYVQMGNQILYYKQFGIADIETKKQFDDYTLVNLGGLSKTFIAYGILILQQEGKLNLEDSILKFIPDFKNKDFAKKIKIRHLLTHTSGLKDLPLQKMDSVHFLNIKDGENFDLVKYSNTLAFEPGNNFLYSDQAFSALVIILEKVSGVSWQEFVQQKICAPAGMTFTKFSGKPDEQVSGSHGYRKINGVYSEHDQGEVPKMYTAVNGGVWSNVVDLRKYLYALQYCLFLKCDNVKLSQELLVPFNWYSPHRPPHSYCWFIGQIPETESSSISYEGKIGGYRTEVMFVPSSELNIVIVSNNSTSYSQQLIPFLKKFNYIK
ncbi:MAG: beta-lactamase family protein [Sphingobacteriaceae bacterium]|nr:beta-lactamase family protein [Sphingobacteriaceae bacterium]